MQIELIDRARVLAHRLVDAGQTSALKPIRLLGEVVATANDLVGRPLCSAAELEERRGGSRAAAATSMEVEPAPVAVYFDGRDHRTQKKITELLGARDIAFQVLDVSNDEATHSWAVTAAKQSEFPLVFIAGAPVGGLHELTQLDVSGELVRRVRG